MAALANSEGHLVTSVFTRSSVILNLVTSAETMSPENEHADHDFRFQNRKVYDNVFIFPKMIHWIEASLILAFLTFTNTSNIRRGRKNRINSNHWSRINWRPSPKWPWKGLLNLDEYNPGQRIYWRNAHFIEYEFRDDLPLKCRFWAGGMERMVSSYYYWFGYHLG